MAGLASLGAAAPARAVPAASQADPAAGSWGKAIEVPGLGALNVGGNAEVLSMSCGSPANCAAGGFYTDGSDHEQGFVVSELNGRWGAAIEVPGLAGLNAGGFAQVWSVSCGSAGNCAAVGGYAGSHRGLGFVVSERNGRWGAAIEVPGLRALNAGRNAFSASVSCAAAGNCAAGGSYNTDGSGDGQGFVAVERNGRWGAAIQVPGLRALTRGRYGNAGVSSVSCRPAGNCAAGGSYTDGPAHYQGFVVSQRHGRWGTAIEVPGLGALNSGRLAEVTSVSCASAGNCAADGSYTDASFHEQVFVVSEQNGRWAKAIQVPGLPALNKKARTGDSISPVSCASAGNCAAGGIYTDRFGHQLAFLVSERNGRWAKAIKVPGLPATARDAYVESVSCSSAGNCAAGGSYTDSSGHGHGFLVVERNGRWENAMQIPGLGTLNHGTDSVPSVTLACAAAGNCAAGGIYTDGSGHFQGFVVSQPTGLGSVAGYLGGS